MGNAGRRHFLITTGALLVAPLAARAQKKTMPAIGYLSGGAPAPFAPLADAFRQGLSETGYIEGQNVTIEYRWAAGQYDRLPGLAADLVGRKVDVIATSGGDLAARAAKNATPTIPIVSTIGDDPVAVGLVASLARPGGNLTGVGFMFVQLHAKRLELMAELVPQAKVIALLVNPKSPQTERVTQAVQEAARGKGMNLHVLTAGAESEIDIAFASLVQSRVGAVLVQADPFYLARREQIAALAAGYAIPATYEGRPFVAAGGLMSYGPSFTAVYRQLGVYVGKVLKGAKPGDLPVEQPTKFELVLNLKTAKKLGLNISRDFLARVDEVIQ
ncbi:MAG TPA: ABC transporter substrate-binding protein [Blastocatellia bacterium]|nr:ABC transporter substrate-binding protein [Blastocatellia bacterium]